MGGAASQVVTGGSRVRRTVCAAAVAAIALLLAGCSGGTTPPESSIGVEQVESMPLQARFSDQSSGSVDSRLWDFGDGATSAEPDPTHQYTEAGVYTVSLMVENSAGSSTSSVEVEVLPGPVVELEIEPADAELTVGSTTSFSVSGFDEFGNEVGDVDVAWSAGDGGSIAADGSYTAGTEAGEFDDEVTAVVADADIVVAVDVRLLPDGLDALELEPDGGTIGAGEPVGLDATALDRFGNVVDDADITWMSSGGDIDGDGVFTARSVGEVEVTATAVQGDERVSATAIFDVEASWCGSGLVTGEGLILVDGQNPFFAQPSVLESYLASILDLVPEVERLAPPEIVGDMEIFFDGIRELDAALAAVGYDFFALEFATVEALLEDPAFVEASENIEAYNFEICGVGEPPLGDLSQGPDVTIPEGASLGELAAALLQESLGLTAEEASCIVDNLDLETFDASDPDINELLIVLQDCDIDLAALAQ